jgi:hypothetical protein
VFKSVVQFEITVKIRITNIWRVLFNCRGALALPKLSGSQKDIISNEINVSQHDYSFGAIPFSILPPSGREESKGTPWRGLWPTIILP